MLAYDQRGFGAIVLIQRPVGSDQNLHHGQRNSGDQALQGGVQLLQDGSGSEGRVSEGFAVVVCGLSFEEAESFAVGLAGVCCAHDGSSKDNERPRQRANSEVTYRLLRNADATGMPRDSLRWCKTENDDGD
jgi:hypothetical protein